MTTGNSSLSAQRPQVSKRRSLYAIGGVMLILALIAMFNFSALKGNAQLGAAYAAHVNCSCRYIEGRDEESCAADDAPGSSFVRVSDEPDEKRVTASVPFLAKAAAQLRGEFGCIPLNDEEMDALD